MSSMMEEIAELYNQELSMSVIDEEMEEAPQLVTSNPEALGIQLSSKYCRSSSSQSTPNIVLPTGAQAS